MADAKAPVEQEAGANAPTYRVCEELGATVQKLTLAPGDLLAVLIPAGYFITADHAARIKATIEPLVPVGVRILVLDSGMTLGRVEFAPE